MTTMPGRHHELRLLRHALLVVLAAGSACGAEAVSAPAVAISFDDNGLASLTYDGFEYLSNGRIGTTWNDAAIQRRLDGTTVAGDMKSSQLAVDAPHRTVVRTFAWGILRCIYTADGSRLSMTMFATNTSPLPIAALQLQALELKFPGKPREYDLVTPIMTANIGAPTILPLTTDRSLVIACNDDVDQPLSLGYPWANDRPAATVYPLYVDTGHRWNLPNSHPSIDRVIHPGCTDCYHLSLRFGPPTATLSQLAGDILAKFRQVHPSQLVW
ncbi:MAG: hypothetical protein H0W83_00765, partial [Planctomycetes bacterium]|nr:hypothetical protein [Planctomycetota bacterium]